MGLSRRQVWVGLRKHEPMAWLGSQRSFVVQFEDNDQTLLWLFVGDSSLLAQRLAIQPRIRAIEEVVFRTTLVFIKRRGP